MIAVLRAIFSNAFVMSSFAVFFVIPWSFGDSHNDELKALIIQALDRYGSISQYESSGRITIMRRGPDVYVGGESVPGPTIVRNREFHFQFERGGRLRLRLFQMVDQDKTPFKPQPTHEILTQTSGLYSYFANGKLVLESNSLREIALSCASQDKWLLGFLMDVLNPDSHYKLLDGKHRSSGKRQIGNSKTQGIRLASTSRKRIWIDPATGLISRVLYVQDKRSLKGEIAQLEKRLQKLDDSQLSIGNEIAMEIDALTNPPGYRPRFIYEFTSQVFN